MKIQTENIIKLLVTNYLIFIIIIVITRAGNVALIGTDLTDNANMGSVTDNIIDDTHSFMGIPETTVAQTGDAAISVINSTLGSQAIVSIREVENSQQFDAVEGIWSISNALGKFLAWTVQAQVPLLSLWYTFVVPTLGTPISVVMVLFLLIWQLTIVYYLFMFIFGYRLKG